MKFAGLLVMPAGFFLSIAALVLFPATNPAARGGFVLCGLAVEALGLVDTTELDLIVLDLNMPVKDGWETCNQLCVKNPLLPVILITGRPNQYFSAVASGVSALLEKPLDFLKLLSTIQTLLKESTEARQAGHNARPTTFCYVPWTP